MATFQISITDKCNANCPFCISKMTYRVNHDNFNWDNLEEACWFARARQIRIAKITGKWGEPLMVPERITAVLPYLHGFEIELQTNAKETLSPRCRWPQWKNLGLDIISISSVHWDYSKNRLVYGKNYPNLESIVNYLKMFRYRIRINCLLLKGWIDSIEKIDEFINRFARVDQISFIPVGAAQNCPTSRDNVKKWVCAHQLSPEEVQEIVNYLNNTYKKTSETCYSKIYCYKGKSIYFADCLKIPPPDVGYRHLIYFPDGTLRYSWEDPNSIVNTKVEEKT